MIRAFFAWPWNENARTKQKQQTNGNRWIWLLCQGTDTNARGFWLVKRTLGWKNVVPEDLSRNHCARPRTEANCHCDVSSERPLITSRSRAQSYAPRERKLWWKKFKIKRFAGGCDEIWDSRNIEGKDKLSTDPLTAILTGLDHFYGIYGASRWNGRFHSPQPFHFSFC